ncbi:MAG TPA: amidohydrolase family protein [Rhodothermales bacterium]
MSTSMNESSHRAWLDQVQEEILEPDLPIIDAHHHLFRGYGKPVPWQPDYWSAEHARDLAIGHNIRATVYVECGFGYRDSGPAELRPVGETELIREYGETFRSATSVDCCACAAIVGFADLRLGGAVEETLEAHLQAAPDRFRGIRQIVNWDPSEEVRYPGFAIEPGLATSSAFLDGFSRLAKWGLSFDAWMFHPQLPEIRALAARFPDTTIILDHVGGPVGIGPYAGRRAEILAHWKKDIAALAEHPNVFVKLGGLSMEHAGFHWHERPTPPTSDELAAAMGDYILYAIDAFGPERCMFESNFPVDKVSCSYAVLWNAFKKLSRRFSNQERASLFCETAARVYRPVVDSG